MVAVAVGCAARGRTIPFVNGFAAFLVSRAHDQLRMAVISRSNVKVVGCHGGVTAGTYKQPHVVSVLSIDVAK